MMALTDPLVTPWTVARQVPLPKGFSRQEYWSQEPFPSPGDQDPIYQIKFYRTASSALSVMPDQWRLLTVTYDGKKVVLYCDGVAAAEKEMTVLPAEKTKSLSIGSYKNGLAYPLLGAVNSLKFYGFCKTAGQVAEQYASVFGE